MKPLFPKLQRLKYEIEFLHHAEAIIRHDLPTLALDLDTVFGDLSIAVEELVRGGGGESPMTQRIRRALESKDWRKRFIETKKTIEIKKLSEPREVLSTSHEIDHIKSYGAYVAAMEIEWNNKDPFFDRDLENFKRLHSDGAISLAILITRGTSLHEAIQDRVLQFAKTRGVASFSDLEEYDYNPTKRQRKSIDKAIEGQSKTFAQAWANHFVSDKFGEATTHWRKLQDRVKRGVGNPCPLLLIGIPDTVLTD